MKKIMLLVLILTSAPVFAQAQFKPVDDGSSVKFTISNFGFDVNGSFSGLQGNITFDPKNTGSAGFDVSIAVATINTGNSLRDSHLKDADYFDAANYPLIRLISGKITGDGKKDAYTFTGRLLIKGKAKDIAFPFTAVAVPDGYIFSGSFKINRKDFGIGGASTIADELMVALTVHAVK